MASQNKIPDIPSFSKNDNSKVINVLSDKLHLYSAHCKTQQPEAGIGEHKAMQVPQATLLENLTLANTDSSVGFAKLPSQWGCKSQTEAAPPSAPTKCVRCQLQPSVSPCTESSMHGCLLHTCAHRQHTNTQTCKPAAPAMRQC